MWQQYGPEASVKGVDKKAFYDAKFGKDKWKSFMPRLSQVPLFRWMLQWHARRVQFSDWGLSLAGMTT